MYEFLFLCSLMYSCFSVSHFYHVMNKKRIDCSFNVKNDNVSHRTCVYYFLSVLSPGENPLISACLDKLCLRCVFYQSRRVKACCSILFHCVRTGSGPPNGRLVKQTRMAYNEPNKEIHLAQSYRTLNLTH